MDTLYLNSGLAFLEGLALITSPCILPILPIVLAGSLEGDTTIEGANQRPLGIILGFVITFALFTLFARSLVQHLGINLDWIRIFAFGFILLFGIILISDFLSDKFNLFTQRLANFGLRHTENDNTKQGFLSGLILGGFISLIWVPCAGPILAAAIVQTAIQKTNWHSLIIFLSFAFGSVLPMVLIAWLGKKMIGSINYLKKHSKRLRKIFGFIIIMGTLIAAFSTFTSIEILSSFKPAKSYDIIKANNRLIDGLNLPYSAPDLKGNNAWINSPALRISQLRGKVVLIDFWTYSCINCVRTLPYLKNWYHKYHKDGFEIIGVHTPEFEFEKSLENVKKAIVNYQVPYPVMLDNDYLTWINYHNEFWPAHYLIDKEGRVVYEHSGEGKYLETEENIRFLLGLEQPIEANMKPKENIQESTYSQTLETYLGYKRARHFKSPEKRIENGINQYTFPQKLNKDDWALQGKWKIEGQRVVAEEPNTALRIHFTARKVFVVMGSLNQKPIQAKVLLNGKPIDYNSGADVKQNILLISNDRLYEIVNLAKASSNILELQLSEPGVQIYTFTFGN